MKKALLLSAVLLLGTSSFADTIINNFTGYNNGYFPFALPSATPRRLAKFSPHRNFAIALIDAGGTLSVIAC